MNKLLFIINPFAGSKGTDIKSLSEKILPEFKKEFAFTEYPGHAAVISGNSIGKGYKAIVATGGDGTLNEVAKTLVNTKEHLGIIPAGSGNGFARHLGIPISIRKSLAAIKNAKSIESDVGVFNESYFLATCGFGFDARVAASFSHSNKRGFWTYLRTTVKEYLRFKPEIYNYSIDNRTTKSPIFLLTIANTSQYGSNARIAPGAEIDSHILLCCKVESMKLPSIPIFSFQLFTGRIRNNKNYEQIICKTFHIPKYSGFYHLDGEPGQLENTNVNIEIIPKGLNVLVPGS